MIAFHQARTFWAFRVGYGDCELLHTAVAQLRVPLMMGNEHKHWGNTMHGTIKLAAQAGDRGGEPSQAYWMLALIVIVLVSLTFAALEVFLSGDQSLSAIEAAMGVIVD